MRVEAPTSTVPAARTSIRAGRPAQGRGITRFRDCSALRVVIEYYGKGFHGPRRVPHDERRANAIAAAGWTMLTANAATFGPDRQAFISALGAVVRGRAA